MRELNKNKNVKTYCLFSGRHDLPENQGALFDSFDFENFVPVGTEKLDEAINHLEKGETIALYVTGLTPALTYLLSKIRKYEGKIILLHYDKEKQAYVEQLF